MPKRVLVRKSSKLKLLYNIGKTNLILKISFEKSSIMEHRFSKVDEKEFELLYNMFIDNVDDINIEKPATKIEDLWQPVYIYYKDIVYVYYLINYR